ncbi:MAG: outer membrane protein assembly factor BamD [Planctomycetes bacterium]|nr:outer membrane protein assembly factor BamD [Planctomycetota bacterium]
MSFDEIGYLLLTLCAAGVAGCAAALPTEGRLVLRNGKYVRMAPPAKGSPAGELSLVDLYVERGQNRKAVAAAKRFLKRYPADERGEEVMLLASQAQMARGRYMKAYKWCEKLLDRYAAGEYFARTIEREFEIATAFLGGRKQVVWGFLHFSAKVEALKMLERIAEYAPASATAEEALLLIADYHFEDGNYVRAVEAYDHYLEKFPHSRRGAYATFRSAEAVLAQYRGSAYEDLSLARADWRFRNFVKLYPDRRDEAQPYLDKIVAMQAEKDYSVGRFYERLGRDGAAAFYYAEVKKRYGKTPWSVKATGALADMEERSARTREPR